MPASLQRAQQSSHVAAAVVLPHLSITEKCMKLYYSPGACALSPHIVALEAGIALSLEKVDGKAKRTESGADFWQVNPKGYVPALALDNGELLTEGPAIVQYLADLKPESNLAPANGTLARYRLQEMLGYINSELHKSYSPLFKAETPEATRAERKEYLLRRYRLIEDTLAKQPWLLGEHFTAADAYLFTVTNWAKHVELDLSGFAALMAFQQRVAGRPAVQAALEAEGSRK
jgi:glutathione S-transferase